MGARIASNMTCVHCKTTETPLWRAGPAGPKTLCNACGVRWKKTGSVVPRAKRPSTSALSSTSTQPSSTASLANSTSNAKSNDNHQARKRARTTHHASSPSPFDTPTQSAPSAQSHRPVRPRFPPPDPLPLLDPAARVATAVLPAPRPVSVFRVADAARSKYDSVFSGLMVVNRVRNTSAKSGKGASPESGRPCTRTQAHQLGAKTQLFDVSGDESLVPPSPSPPPAERMGEREAVYVTEVHAPSPSPSPPPMPRVQRFGEGGAFRLLLAAMADESKPGSL